MRASKGGRVEGGYERHARPREGRARAGVERGRGRVCIAARACRCLLSLCCLCRCLCARVARRRARRVRLFRAIVGLSRAATGRCREMSSFSVGAITPNNHAIRTQKTPRNRVLTG